METDEEEVFSEVGAAEEWERFQWYRTLLRSQELWALTEAVAFGDFYKYYFNEKNGKGYFEKENVKCGINVSTTILNFVIKEKREEVIGEVGWGWSNEIYSFNFDLLFLYRFLLQYDV